MAPATTPPAAAVARLTRVSGHGAKPTLARDATSAADARCAANARFTASATFTARWVVDTRPELTMGPRIARYLHALIDANPVAALIAARTFQVVANADARALVELTMKLRAARGRLAARHAEALCTAS